MQMGRWFGYRKGYDELCRIFMSEESIEWYRYISDATDELREEVKRYEDTGLTPRDFGLRVRSDITSLLVTARNKMRAAEDRVCVVSLSGEVIETPEIYSDFEKNRVNKEAVINLVHDLEENGIGHVASIAGENKKYGYIDVPKGKIIDFLKNIDISPKNEQFSASAIIDFISKYRGSELDNWNIEFATGNSEHVMSQLGYGMEFHYPTRIFTVINDGKIYKMNGPKRRLGSLSEGRFGLTPEQESKLIEKYGEKTTSQKACFRGIDRNPELMIYFVELKLPKDTSKSVKKDADIEAAVNKYTGIPVVGFAIGIPSLKDRETQYARYMFNKVAIQQIFEGEFDEFDDDEVD